MDEADAGTHYVNVAIKDDHGWSTQETQITLYVVNPELAAGINEEVAEL